MKLKCLSLAVLAVAGSCNPESTEEPATIEPAEYDYSLIENKRIAWKDVLSKTESRYLVYFYSEYCAYCKQIKQDILSYYSKNIDNMYFVDAYDQKAIYKSNDGLLIGTKSMENFYIFGTPFLVEITNYTVTNWYAGVDSIKLYISSRTDNKK